MSKEKAKLGFWDYEVPDKKLTDVEKAADFLLWAAQIMPGRPVPIEQIVRVALSLPKLPREDSTAIKQFKNRMGPMKKILYDRHQRWVIYHPGGGYRATTGSEDTARTFQEQKARGVASAIRGLSKARDIIKRGELKAATAQRFDVIGAVHKKLLAPAVYNPLLAPDATEPEKK